MGQSLDRGHVLALSLWDDVEVNMLWLDSAYPLDKPRDKPGVLRGDCPGGQTSTPTYLRDTYPDGYVTFASAAIGEIGSTLLGGSPAPSPGGGGSCGVGTCQGPAECRDKDEAPCRHLANEGKCTWIPPVPCTSTSSPSTSAPTPAPTPAPTEPTCELDRDVRACVAQGGSFECERCTNDITGEPCCSCHGEENPVTTTETITTTTSSQAAGLCKSWCARNSKSWEKKCKWTKCAGCSPCSARRLRGSDAMFL